MTLLGYIALPVGIVSLLVSRKWLYRLFIFWTLFSASSAANFGQGGDGSALQLWMVFGLLWLIRLTIEHQLAFSFAVDRRISGPCFWILSFLLVAVLSLLMPVYINGTLSITSPVLFDGSETPLFLTIHNFTQVLYLVFGGVIAVSVAHYNLRDENRHETERAILFAATVLASWGLFQFVCRLTGVPYPDYILNNSASASGKGFLETIDGVGRISSAAVEPSMFAQSLLTLLPLTLPAWMGKGAVLSLTIDRFCSLLFITLLILSTSSTGYVGLVLLVGLSFLLFVRTKLMPTTKALKAVFFGAVVATGSLMIAIISIPAVQDVIRSAILRKAVSGSGLERAMTIALAFGYFKKFPFLGIGWGSATSHDTIVKLLSNVGLLGTTVFFLAMYFVVRNNWRSLDRLATPMGLSRAAWFLGFSVFLLTSIAIEFPLAFGNFWVVLGMAISTSWKPVLPIFIEP